MMLWMIQRLILCKPIKPARSHFELLNEYSWKIFNRVIYRLLHNMQVLSKNSVWSTPSPSFYGQPQFIIDYYCSIVDSVSMNVS